MVNENNASSEDRNAEVIDLTQPDSTERSFALLRKQIEVIFGHIDAMKSLFQNCQLEDLKRVADLSPDQVEKDERGDVYILTEEGRLTLSEFIRYS